jgi:hypothetical protein
MSDVHFLLLNSGVLFSVFCVYLNLNKKINRIERHMITMHKTGLMQVGLNDKTLDIDKKG